MFDVVFDLLGFDYSSFNIDDNVLYVVLALLLFYCLGYVFNFIQILMERFTSKKR